MDRPARCSEETYWAMRVGEHGPQIDGHDRSRREGTGRRLAPGIERIDQVGMGGGPKVLDQLLLVGDGHDALRPRTPPPVGPVAEGQPEPGSRRDRRRTDGTSTSGWKRPPGRSARLRSKRWRPPGRRTGEVRLHPTTARSRSCRRGLPRTWPRRAEPPESDRPPRRSRARSASPMRTATASAAISSTAVVVRKRRPIPVESTSRRS